MDIELENSLLVLTAASLLKRKMPEETPRAGLGDCAEENGSPLSNRKKARKSKATLSAGHFLDVNVNVSFTTKAERRAAKHQQDPSSGSEENNSDASPPQSSISPSALVARLDPNLPLSATLDRGLLLTMSSKEFESFFTQLCAERSLTRSEEKMLKAQRRLISNRESAQASRRRKKAYIEELEGRVLEMTYKMSQVAANNAALSAQTAELLSENANMKIKMEEMAKALRAS